MAKAKRALGKGGAGLDLKKAMRSRISDTLTPPPAPPSTAAPKELPKRYDPRAIADRVWMTFLEEDSEATFEVRFQLNDRREFALRGDKEGFGSIQALEPFVEVHERLLEAHHSDIKKVEVFTDLKGLTFSSYDDFLEWLAID